MTSPTLSLLRYYHYSNIITTPTLWLLRRYNYSDVITSPTLSLVRRYHYSNVIATPTLCLLQHYDNSDSPYPPSPTPLIIHHLFITLRLYDPFTKSRRRKVERAQHISWGRIVSLTPNNHSVWKSDFLTTPTFCKPRTSNYSAHLRCFANFGTPTF